MIFAGAGATVAEPCSKYGVGTKASRSSSRSTTNPRVGVCTRPMEAPLPTMALAILEVRKPTNRSRNLRTSAESTIRWSTGRGCRRASVTASSVTSWKVTR